MKNLKILFICICVISLINLSNCKNDEEKQSISIESKKELVDQCFLVRGKNGELIDLHILRNENNQAFITTTLSQEKSTSEEIPEYIIIASNVEFAGNTFTLQKTDANYWVFEVSLEDPVMPKAAPGGGATITAECHCLAGSGDCRVELTTYPNGQVFTAHCMSSLSNRCEASGLSQCKWTLPEIIVKPDLNFINAPKTTTVIINSETMNYNGLLYN